MTETLAKAVLHRLKQIPGSGKNAPTRTEREPNGAFEVQFNPTSLKITRQNNIDRGGSTTRSQRRQNPSAQSATLAFDLEFDTAEGDGSGNPLDVRTRTLTVRQFVEPSKEKPKDPPPPVEFIWGSFTFTGIVTALTEDLDYFSVDGIPLRAKVSITITEQNPDWEAKLVGPGARDGAAATPPGGGAGSGPGSGPTSNPDRTATANEGESVQQLLAREDADPAAWRSAMAGLDSPLGLAAGASVQLSASASVGVGLGVTAGFAAGIEAGASASLGAALGVGAGVSAGAGASASAGFALAAGGGIGASAALVATAQVEASVAAARAAFEVPVDELRAVGPGPVDGLRAADRGVVSRPDPRSRSYGRGIPLRARGSFAIEP